MPTRVKFTSGGNPLNTGPVTIKNVSSQDYTLLSTDAQTTIVYSSATAGTITVPADNTLNFPIGTHITVFQAGTTSPTISAASGATINASPGFRISGQYRAATLFKRAANTWALVGSLSI